jgi:hypothetical protein
VGGRRKPIPATEIYAEIAKRKLAPGLKGKTPDRTVAAQLAVHAKRGLHIERAEPGSSECNALPTEHRPEHVPVAQPWSRQGSRDQRANDVHTVCAWTALGLRPPLRPSACSRSALAAPLKRWCRLA